MKIKTLVLTIALSISGINYSYADATAAMDKLHDFMQKRAAQKAQKEMVQGLGEQYGNEVAKDIAKKGAKRLAIRGVKKIAFFPLSTAKIAYKHPLLTATAVAGGVGVYINTLGYAISQFANDPSGFENYVEKNPDKINDISEKVIEKYNKAKHEDEQDKYEVLLSILDYDISDNIFKTTQDQKDLEKTSDFTSQYEKLEKVADEYDRNHFKQCSLKDALRMVKEPPLKFRKYNENMDIVETRDTNDLSKEYSVSQYGRLKGKIVYKSPTSKEIDEQLSIERDHIPSYKALELFFTKKYPNIIKEKKIKNRYANLNNNASVINLRYVLHRENRTTGERNNVFSLIDSVDFVSLRAATIKDYATILVLNLNNKAQYDHLFNAFELIYARNKELCIYDI